MTVWDYPSHPGDCCPRREPDGTITTCCRECAGTGIFPVPWIRTIEEGRARDPDDASCVCCKASGRAIVALGRPADLAR